MKPLDLSRIDNIIPHVRIVISRTGYKGWHVPERTILDHEFVLILGGKGSFTVKGSEYPVRPGMLFYFYPNLIHSGKTGLNPPISFLAVHFSFSIGNYLNSRWSYNVNPPLLPLEPVNQVYNEHKIIQIFSTLYETWSQKRPGYQWQSNILFQQMLFEIFYDLGNPPQNHANIKRMEKVLSYINEQYNKKIAVDELCSLVDLSPGYFYQVFKDITGRTPSEYIQQIRIDRSKDLLLNTSLKIKEIAHQVGFKDEFYFARVFKKLEGYSPSEFSRRYIR